MAEMIICIIANLLVGGMIGICGIAGFLLPVLYTGLLEMPVPVALSASFLAFLVSGSIGSINYYKKGNLDIRISLILGIGSLLGGLLGVKLHSFITAGQAKTLLYLVVLLSGLSILLRRDKTTASPEDTSSNRLFANPIILISLGFITGTVCSLSGAGGPVLVMPLLASLGMRVHMAVGVALFDSVFIAIPAILGYAAACNLSEIWLLLVLTAVAHGIGVMTGSSQAHRINARPLKTGVAVFSVSIAVYMLATLFQA